MKAKPKKTVPVGMFRANKAERKPGKFSGGKKGEKPPGEKERTGGKTLPVCEVGSTLQRISHHNIDRVLAYKERARMEGRRTTFDDCLSFILAKIKD